MKLAFFLLAVLAFMLAFLAELGLGHLLGPQGQTPGIGIRMLALIDIALVWALGMMLIEMTIPTGRWTRLQGIVTLILSLVAVLSGIALIVGTVSLLILMVSLLMAVPFGTVVYLATWGDFPAETAGAVLSLIMLLKLTGTVFLVLASPAIVKNKGLMILLALTLGSTVLTGFLIAFVPGIVASVADVIGALVSAVLGTIWLIVMLVGAVFAVIRALRSVVPD